MSNQINKLIENQEFIDSTRIKKPLTTEEIELKQLEAKKRGLKNEIEYAKKISTAPKKKTMTAGEMFNGFSDAYLKAQIIKNPKTPPVKWEWSEGKREMVQKLAFYFSEDQKFEALEQNYSFRKGVFLYGGFGTGKTGVLEAFRLMANIKFLKISMQEVTQAFNAGGYEAIERYQRLVKRSGLSYGWLFDDVGEEKKTKNFAEEGEVFEICLKAHYRKGNINRIHATSNLKPEDLGARYGERVSSRTHEMFNFIYIGSEEDMRKRL